MTGIYQGVGQRHRDLGDRICRGQIHRERGDRIHKEQKDWIHREQRDWIHNKIRAGTSCPEVTGGSQQHRDAQIGVLGMELRSGGIRDQRYRCTQLESGDSELGMPVHPD